MIEPGEVLAVTLAAGLSSRFGGDKLAARVGDASVLEASLGALGGLVWAGQCVVLDRRRAASWSGDVAVIVNPQPARGMGHSLALAAREAMARDAAYLLVTLGDMPKLTGASIARLLAEAMPGPDSLAAMAVLGGKAAPPALFGKNWLSGLAETGGDSGARDILRDPSNAVRLVELPASEAIDIDTREDLSRLS